MNRRSLLIGGGAIIIAGDAGGALAQSTERVVGADWGWLSDYAYLWAQWTVNCPRDRRCQVGMGIFSFGEPRGEKIRFSGNLLITTIGIGAIHIRADDGKGDCPVRLDQGDVGLIPLTPLLPKGVRT